MCQYEIDFNTPIHVHFIGIGGCNMSGLAELLHSRGFTVTGSDSRHNPACTQLESEGIHVEYGQRASNVTPETDLVVYTAAIKPDNFELAAAKDMGIPTMTRAMFLGQLMKQYKDPISVAGTHGKTTTTSMLSMILIEAGMDPTISSGAVIEPIHSSSRTGHSEHIVVESCEYTDSFLELYPRHEIILNIEEEHLDYFKNIDQIRRSFRQFMEKLDDKSNLVIQGDIQELSSLTKGLKAKITTYGIAGGRHSYDYSAANISYDENGRGRYDLMHGDKVIGSITLGVVGEHNVSNSVAAAAMADLLGAPISAIAAALKRFTGAERRFEKKGEISGITIMDDYAHHPTEIRATLEAAKNYPHKTLWCVFQPHTYSRTKTFFNDFVSALSLADKIVLADIYPAREKDPGDISSRDIAAKLKEFGKEVYYFPCFDEIENFLLSNCTNGDLLITMGAGDIVKVGEALLGK